MRQYVYDTDEAESSAQQKELEETEESLKEIEDRENRILNQQERRTL